VDENQHDPQFGPSAPVPPPPQPEPLSWQYPYGQPYGQPYSHPFGTPLPPRRRTRAVPAALAGLLAALVAAAAVLLHGGAVGTLAAGRTNNGSGSTASGSAASSSTSPDYDTGVVNILAALGQSGTAAGTGMILDADGTVLTNNHVVEDATLITATDVNTGKRYAASVVGTDANDDIAVIRLSNASGLTPVSIGNSGAVKVGQQVVAIGNAGGKGGTPSEVTGSVTALGQTITATDSSGGNAETLHNLIQVDAPIVAGDSGGPLTDSSGKVIGINTAATGGQAAQSGSDGSNGFGSGGFGRFGGNSRGQASAGFAIPIASALTVAKQIEAGQSDSSSSSGSTNDHGYLGVEVTDGSISSATPGAAVNGTVAGSPAERAGLSAGDVIVSIDGHPVTSATDLSDLMKGSSAGQQVSVGWVDAAGNTATATMTLVGSAG
jgi:S1-C subfamily serine protease